MPQKTIASMPAARRSTRPSVAAGRRSSARLSSHAPVTPDERFLTIDGRRWRRSDPLIPASLQQQLVNELMSARRAVAAARNERQLKEARQRVHDAKVALGERGRAWWLEPSAAARNLRIDAAILALLHSRQDGASICPSEAARIVGGKSWRALMDDVRSRAAILLTKRRIRITRRGRTVIGDPTTGVLRYELDRR